MLEYSDKPAICQAMAGVRRAATGVLRGVAAGQESLPVVLAILRAKSRMDGELSVDGYRCVRSWPKRCCLR